MQGVCVCVCVCVDKMLISKILVLVGTIFGPNEERRSHIIRKAGFPERGRFRCRVDLHLNRP